MEFNLNKTAFGRQLLFAQEQYEEYLEMFAEASEHQDLPVVFGFVSSEELNALATQHRGTGFVGIFSGTWRRLGKFLSMLFADSRTFPDVGDVDREAELPDFYVQYNWGTDQIRRHVTPQDTTRRKVAYLCAFYAMDFIFLHELCHIKLGHVTYHGLNGAEFGFPERPGDHVLGSTIEQAMELQADGNAAAFLFALESRSKDEELHYYAAVGAIVAITLMGLSSDRLRISDYESCSHPHPAVRLLCLRKDFDSYVHAQDQDGLRQQYSQAEEDCLDAISRLGIRSLTQVSGQEEESVEQEYLRLSSASRGLDETLKPYLWSSLSEAAKERLRSTDGPFHTRSGTPYEVKLD